MASFNDGKKDGQDFLSQMVRGEITIDDFGIKGEPAKRRLRGATDGIKPPTERLGREVGMASQLEKDSNGSLRGGNLRPEIIHIKKLAQLQGHGHRRGQGAHRLADGVDQNRWRQASHRRFCTLTAVSGRPRSRGVPTQGRTSSQEEGMGRVHSLLSSEG